MPEALLPLEAIDPADRRFGGKATGLARLLRASAVVPEGFAVAADTVPPSQWGPDLRERFVAHTRALRGPLAVRSSALAEDQRDRSFAGLFTTVLDVDSAEAALAAAERCIESGGSERVLAYAGSSRPLAVGLVVQRMASARAAGALFTRDPNGADGGMVLEAVAGLGESLVGGHQDPERFRIYRSGLGDWEIQRERRTAAAASAVLSDDEVERLATEAARLAEVLGEPLDLEWAITRDGERGMADATGTGAASIVWLQARPITTLVDPPRWVVERSYAAPTTVRSRCGRTGTCARPCRSPFTHSPGRSGARPSCPSSPSASSACRGSRGSSTRWRPRSHPGPRLLQLQRGAGDPGARAAPALDAPSRRLPRRRGDRRSDGAWRPHAATPARRR